MTIARLSRLAIVVAAATALAGGVMAGAPAMAQTKQAAQSKPSKPTAGAQHKVAIQVNQNDKAVMDLALNNAKNIAEHFKAKGETVAIELVAYGPGLHMLRSDTSPVKDRISVMSLENPNMTFAACGNTQANQAKAENKPVTLITEAKVTPSGVVRLMELQKQGYAYIRP
ncbi:MAG TPA: DsrE family protein [Hyphomicrobiaceae bacterium]|jgi:intracellular sulfur oxidation DsrE/DsrF family protein|nr:DsrE family protein [Hyphomicrobiaceae bacterium]